MHTAVEVRGILIVYSMSFVCFNERAVPSWFGIYAKTLQSCFTYVYWKDDIGQHFSSCTHHLCSALTSNNYFGEPLVPNIWRILHVCPSALRKVRCRWFDSTCVVKYVHHRNLVQKYGMQTLESVGMRLLRYIFFNSVDSCLCNFSLTKPAMWRVKLQWTV